MSETFLSVPLIGFSQVLPMVHIERFIEVSQVLGVIIGVVFAAVVAVVAYSASDFVVQ